jgi:hypothetical protein
MSNDSESIYEEAYAAHYEDADAEKAKRLYRAVIEKFPDSKEAGYARTQLQNLDSNPPQPDRSRNLTSTQSTSSGRRNSDSSPSAVASVKNAFPVLETISTLFKVLALVNALGCIAVGIYVGGAAILAGILLGAFSGVLCWAIAESILVLLAIEKNTRAAARAVESSEEQK